MHKQASAIAAAVAVLLASTPASAGVVISQIYGGNGNAFASDYVELFNNGRSAVDLSGWSVQYASATGTGSFASNGVTPLAGTLQPGHWYLVQLKTTSGNALPTPDATGNSDLSGSNGKVALLDTATGLACNGGSTACSAEQQAHFVDLVGYGSANFYKGSGAAPAASSSSALLRKAGGCTDSGNNASDFVTGTPAPRNSATAAVPCSGSGGNDGGTVAFRRIYEIQGSGDQSPLVGQTVTTSGVVTKLTNNGFFLQDASGDGNPATSDGIFVFTSSAPTVSAGQLLQLSGKVAEFAAGSGSVTQLTTPSAITLLGSGSITPVPITLPVSGGLERYEGMLVTLVGLLTVDQNYFQARYGQLTLSAGGRLETPTNRYRPGPQAQALAADNAARRIVLEDGSSAQNVNPTPFTGPTGALRAGDLIGSITGVIDYGLSTSTSGAGAPSDYRIVPLDKGTLRYTTANPRPTAAPALGGNVKVASLNVLNYFTTFTNGATASGQTGQGCSQGGTVSASNCRGADSLAEFQRQRAKIVEALAALDADVVGLMEIQNNGAVAVQNLVDALNQRVGSGVYAAVPEPAAGTGSDAIKVAMIYKPSRLTRIGAPASDTAAVNSRPPLAQTFAPANGERFTVVVNHLKSKSSCPAAGDANAPGNVDSGDGQGCWNALRVSQADQLRRFVAQLQTASGSNDVLLVGDFNAYAQEDPVYQLTGSGYVDEVGRFDAFGYSYVFDGAAGRLDQALSTGTLSPKVAGAAHWHINADESLAQDYNLEFKQPACASCAPDPYTQTPYRSSDHDPVLVALNLVKTITAAPSSTSVAGTPGDDLIVSGAGRRTLTGGGGRDTFVFSSSFAGGATITDFTPGDDRISFAELLRSLRVPSTDPIGQGYLGCSASGADALLTIDPDAAGPAAARPMVLVKGRSCAELLKASNFLF
ncbi:ExeM/NucH family extracellular endonuclease [Rubrivivax gelatinosus]|uniref:ExeM/NucH family extracellular endonuclease n=1 Tax=Rubrivivax gelatinosus TaxID=28068 RepID=UPI0002E8AA64|nr:ExeM/NucH family extracellular endonuclease [Rubrivivax gelatinosus]MBG6081524.1 putative extracellular nuclease [Rubrivivax gelatinosus]